MMNDDDDDISAAVAVHGVVLRVGISTVGR